MSKTPGHTITGNGFKITGHMQPAPGFSYGHSHCTVSDLRLPKETFRFAVFRDPIKRVISLFKNSVEIRQNEPHRTEHFGLTHVQDALDKANFGLFIQQVYPSWLSHQLWMFSTGYDVEEAVQRIKTLDCVLFTETLNEDFNKLCELIEVNLALKLGHANTSKIDVEITSKHLGVLQEKLALEYRMLEKVRKAKRRMSQSWVRQAKANAADAAMVLRNLWRRHFKI